MQHGTIRLSVGILDDSFSVTAETLFCACECALEKGMGKVRGGESRPRLKALGHTIRDISSNN